MELLCRGCAGNSNEGQTSELPLARNPDEPLLAGIARQRLRRQFKRRPDVRVAARTQSRRAATRWNCYAEVAQAIQTKARRQSCRTHAIPTSRCSLGLLCRGCAGNSNEGQTSELPLARNPDEPLLAGIAMQRLRSNSNEGQTSESPHARNADEPLLAGIAMQRLRRQFKRRPDVRVAARTQSRRAAARWNCFAEVAQAIQTKARRQSCRLHAIPTSRCSLELLCRGCTGNSNEGQTSELPLARNADEPLLVGIAMQRLRRQFKRRPDVRVAARTQSRRAAARWNCYAEVAQAIQTKARRQSCRLHAMPTSRCSLELLCRGCAGNSNEGQTSELPHARNADEPLLVGIAMQRLRRQFKRRPDVRVAARTQSRRAATRWNCYAEVAQAIQTKARRQSRRTHAMPTSRCSLELLGRGCAGSSNEGQTSQSPHARNPDEPLLVGIAMQRLRRQFKRRPDVRVAARTQSRRAATRLNCFAEVAQAIQAKARRQSCRTHAILTSRCSLELLCRGCAGNSNEGQTSELPHARNADEPLLIGIAMHRLRTQFKRRPDARVAARTQPRRAAARWNCYAEVAQAIQTKAGRQSCRTHAMPTSRCSLELLCRGCAGNSNEGQTSELLHARNPDEPLLVGIAMQRLRMQFKRRPDVRVAARTQSRRAAARRNCYAEVAQAIQTKAGRQSCRTHAMPTSRYSLELLGRGCAGNSNEGQTPESPHARNPDEPLLVGIAMQRLRRQFKRRPDVRVAARTQSRRAATRWNCYAKVVQAIQTKAGRQSCRTHAMPTSRCSLELLCRGCAGNSNEGQTSELPHARNPDEPLLVGIAMKKLRRQFKRRPDVRVAARTQSRRPATRWNCFAEVAQAIQTKARRQSCRTHAIPTSRYSFELLCRGCAGNSNEGQTPESPHARNPDEPLLVGIAMQRLRRQFKRRPDVRVAARTQCRRAAARWNCFAEVAQAIQAKARRQSCRTHAMPTSRCSLELLCRGCAGNSNEGQTSELLHARNPDVYLLELLCRGCACNSNEGQTSELPHARNPDEPLLVGIAMQRLRRQFKRRPDVRVAARTQSRRAATRWNCYAEVAQAVQTKARRQSRRTHAIPTSRCSLELLCRGCAGNSNEGRTSESPHARNADEPLLVGIAMQRLRRQFKRRPDVRVAARTQSRRAATRLNCFAEVAQAIQAKARRQSCRTHAMPTSRCSLELLCRGCAGNSNESQTSESPHARNADEPLLAGIARQRLRRQFKRRPDVTVSARTQS